MGWQLSGQGGDRWWWLKESAYQAHGQGDKLYQFFHGLRVFCVIGLPWIKPGEFQSNWNVWLHCYNINKAPTPHQPEIRFSYWFCPLIPTPHSIHHQGLLILLFAMLSDFLVSHIFMTCAFSSESHHLLLFLASYLVCLHSWHLPQWCIFHNAAREIFPNESDCIIFLFGHVNGPLLWKKKNPSNSHM